MSIDSATSSILPEIPKLDHENWFQWSSEMEMFFLGCNAQGISDSSKRPTEASDLAAFNKVDTQLTAYVNAKVSKPYKYLLWGETTASGAWAKLKAHFERFTIYHRMAARKEFYSVIHDPEQPVDIYIEAVSAARAKLQAFGRTVEDMELVDVLLMNLDPSLHDVRTTILAQREEPDIASVKSMLKGAHWAKNRSDPVDKKGWRWCDTTNEDACHRCGRTGHFAARCMYSMPQSVKDWIMDSASCSESSPPASRANNATISNTVFANTARVLVSHFHDSDSDLDDPDYAALGEAIRWSGLLVT